MSATSRVAGAVAAGYALGRFKKLRLAILVGSTMASPKFRSAAVGMIEDRLPGGPVVGTLTKEVGGKLINVGKTAATSIVAARIDSLSQSLADRSQNLRKGAPDQADKSEGEEPEDEYEEQEGEEPEAEAVDEYEEQEGEEPEGEEPEDEAVDEYEEQEGEEPEGEEPEDEAVDEYEEQEGEESEEGEAEELEDQSVQAEDEASGDEEPEEPVARSPRRRRSASPASRGRG
jgi:flagellar biosynthesis GTPase FlhF